MQTHPEKNGMTHFNPMVSKTYSKPNECYV